MIARPIMDTVKALEYNSGIPKTQLGAEDLEALERSLSCMAAINRFVSDTDAELALIHGKR